MLAGEAKLPKSWKFVCAVLAARRLLPTGLRLGPPESRRFPRKPGYVKYSQCYSNGVDRRETPDRVVFSGLQRAARALKEGLSMGVRIQLSGDSASSELAGLMDWLMRSDEFRGRVFVEQAMVPLDQMGAATEVLIVALGAHGVGSVLASSLSVWIRHRRPSVDVEVTNEQGRRVKLSVRDSATIDVAAVLSALLGD